MFKRLEGLSQHLLVDALRAPPQLAPALLPLGQGQQDQYTPLAGDVIQNGAAGAPGRKDPPTRWAGRGAAWTPDAESLTFISVPYLEVRTLFSEVIERWGGYTFRQGPHGRTS